MSTKCPQNAARGKIAACQILLSRRGKYHAHTAKSKTVAESIQPTVVGDNVHMEVKNTWFEAMNDQMPVVGDRVGTQEVVVLRDTGCSGIVVRRGLIKDSELLKQTCKLVDGREISVHIAQVHLDTPYFKGTRHIWFMDMPLYDVSTGNVPGAYEPGKPDPDWKDPVRDIGAVQTREQAKPSKGSRTVGCTLGVKGRDNSG